MYSAGRQFTDYPVASLVQTNNYVLQNSRNFDDLGTMDIEEYEIEM